MQECGRGYIKKVNKTKFVARHLARWWVVRYQYSSPRNLTEERSKNLSEIWPTCLFLRESKVFLLQSGWVVIMMKMVVMFVLIKFIRFLMLFCRWTMKFLEFLIRYYVVSLQVSFLFHFFPHPKQLEFNNALNLWMITWALLHGIKL